MACMNIDFIQAIFLSFIRITSENISANKKHSHYLNKYLKHLKFRLIIINTNNKNFPISQVLPFSGAWVVNVELDQIYPHIMRFFIEHLKNNYDRLSSR